jgi:hypothetical protein
LKNQLYLAPDNRDLSLKERFLLVLRKAIEKTPCLKIDFHLDQLGDYLSDPLQIHYDVGVLSNLLQCNIVFYRIFYFKKYQNIRSTFQKKYGEKAPTLSFFEHGDNYGCILKPAFYKNHFRCNTCCRWVHGKTLPSFLKLHYDQCRRCQCGTALIHGSQKEKDHVCKKRKEKAKKKKEKPICRRAERLLQPGYIENNHHADMEAFTERNGIFVPDSIGLHVAGTGEEVILFGVGPTAMDDFMKYIIKNLKGVLWFYCGGRFDVFFILQWCLKYGYPIDNEKSMIKTSQVTVLTLVTEVGDLEIKDLGRFCQGSLDFNCKGLGLAAEDSKYFFDHSKVRSWEDAYLHQEERLKYLKQDVIAQKNVYECLAAEFWKDYNLNLCDYVSLSHMAFACFSLSLSKSDMYKTKKEDEAAFRQAYRGGRIVMTFPYWISKDFDAIMKARDNPEALKDFYENMNDYIKYLDKNSLYPSVMCNDLVAAKYPCGKYRKVNIVQEKSQKILEHLNNPDKNDFEADFWNQRLVKVDITCPKNLLIPFLMSRNRHGRNIQDLNDKKEEWYTGPELVEAVILGYRVTAIYSYYEWAEYKPIFETFIRRNWDKKAKSKKDTAPYLMAKMLMNALSGKFGQKNIEKKTRLLIGKSMQKELLLNQVNHAIWNEETDEILGIIEEYEDLKDFSPYPIHQSSFILGNSKVSMSQFLRKTGGYWKAEKCSTYGDTDSLLPPQTALVDVDEKEFGLDLGQMKDEKPKDRIFAIITIAPKMNMKLFISWNKFKSRHEIYCDFTAKGIPHRKEAYLAFSDYRQPPLVSEYAWKIFHFLKDRTSSKDHFPEVYLKTSYYISWDRSSGEYVVKDRVVWDDMVDMLYRGKELFVVYGGMQRQLKLEAEHKNIGIALDYNRRELANELWWDKGTRLFHPDDTHYNMISYPIGHEKLKDGKGKNLCDVELRLFSQFQ